MGVIYAITVAGAEKFYIGSAMSFERRRTAHLSMLRRGTHHCVPLQRSMNKRGIDALSFTVLEHVGDNLFLSAREQFWFWRYVGALYNLAPDAFSPRGIKHDAAFGAKVSARMKGNTLRRGAKMSAEARALISSSLKGNSYRTGIPHDAAIKAKIGAGIARAYADGRRQSPDPAIARQNLEQWNRKVLAGDALHPRCNPKRAQEIVALWFETRSFKKTAQAFGVTGEAIAYIVRKYSGLAIQDQRKR